MKTGKIELENGIPLDEYFRQQADILRDLAELADGKNAIIEELIKITKNLNTRLSALEKAVAHIEENYTTVASVKPLIDCHDNLQAQVDILAKTIYEGEEE